MRTRREQAQAYRFVTRRIGSALLSGQPETTELPMRRLGLSVFASAMIAAIVFAAIGVYALIRPGGGKLVDGAIVIERETGARYVYIDRTLHPVLNYTSARLAIGTAQPTVKSLSGRSLRGVDRGEPIGIPNAPDALPDADALLDPPWSTCTMRRSPGSAALASHVMIGGVPDGGRQLGSDALLVTAGTAGDATRYLLWSNHRLKVTDSSVLAALQIASARPVPVGQALLNTIAAGPDLAAGFVFNAGQDGAVINGEAGKLGQVYRTGDQFFVLLDRGLVPIGAVMARLLLAKGGQPIDISASEAGRVQAAGGARFEPDGFPYTMPTLRNSGVELPLLCGVYRAGGGAGGALTTIELYDRPDPRLTEASADLPPARIGPDEVRLADRVLVPGGRGALVRILPAPDAPGTATTRYIVTDQGIKFALPRQDADAVQETLGYAGVTPTPVPAYLLALLPTGPTLDPRAATRFRPATDPSPGRTP